MRFGCRSIHLVVTNTHYQGNRGVPIVTAPRKRITQKDIAKMSGVSQATVSLVLNGRADADVRIAPETRERVLEAIRSTGYVADPIARWLADRHNRILGVFTDEAVFTGAFYHPFLLGI